MIRKLLATTAIATVVATGAFAQTSNTTATPTTPAAGATTTQGAEGGNVNAAVSPADGQLASNLIGEDVYNGTGDDAENIGNVNDLVLNDDGQIESIVIGVGGFLGIGEKNVSVSYDEIDWADREGDRWIVVTTTADALKELPAFDRRAYEPVTANNAATGGNTGAAGTAGTTGAGAPATGTAPVAGSTSGGTAAGGTAAGGTTTMAPAAGTAATTTTDTAAGAANTSTGAVDRASLTEVPVTDLTADNLDGTNVYGAQDAEVGEISDVVLTTDGKVDAVLVDVGGFLGLGAKQVAVGMDDLKFMQDAEGNRYLYTNFTKEQLEAQPEYQESNWATQRDQMRMRSTQ